MGLKSALQWMTVAVAAGIFLSACRKAHGNYPGDEYTFDMVHSKAYDPYSLMPEMPDSMSAILPADGTVPYVGDAIAGEDADSLDRAINLPYEYKNTPEDYERAGRELKSPLDQKDPKVLSEGQHFFNIYCAICHGEAGNGKGNIVTNGRYPGVPPNYMDPAYLGLPDGKMFQSITYGKNAMQSYAYALNKKERWEVIAYINSLQDAYVASHPQSQDSTAMKQ